MMTLRSTVLAVSIAGITVLSRGVQAQVLPERRLVAGVLHLAHPFDALRRAPQWALASSPSASTSGMDAPDFDLTNARQVQLLADGRIIALSSIGSRLVVFAPDGRPERVLGRQGRGPGELMAPSGLTRTRGDTLLIPDASNNRLNWVVPSKGFVRTRPLPALPPLAGVRSVRPAGSLNTGELVLSTAGVVQAGLGGAGAVTRPTASVIMLTSDGARATIVATVPDLEVRDIETRFRGRRSSDSRPLLFTRYATVTAWDTVVATGSGDGYRIDLRNVRGVVRTTITVARPRRVVTSAMRDSMIARALQRLNAPGRERMVDPEELRRQEVEAPAADSLPPYGSWFVTPNRTLWVLDAWAPGDRTRAATAFRQDGAITARLTWSQPGDAVAFTDDAVVLRQTDADDVVSLRVYRMQRPPRAALAPHAR